MDIITQKQGNIYLIKTKTFSRYQFILLTFYRSIKLNVTYTLNYFDLPTAHTITWICIDLYQRIPCTQIPVYGQMRNECFLIEII